MKAYQGFGLICLIAIAISVSALSNDLLGIAPEDEKYYKAEVIKCKEGSKKFKKEQVNDDFCDCPDGSDEPGTSACPGGKFYCRNVGHSPLILFSSRVNDGICDCCDGSDEYDGKVKCKNTCWEAGKVARDKLKKKIATYQEGVTIRKKEVEQAKQTFARDEAELSKLKNEEKVLKGLVQQLREHKEQIEKAEEQERLKKEKEKKSKEVEQNSNEQEEKSTEPPHETQHVAEEHSDSTKSEDGENSSEASPHNAVKEETVESNDNTLVKDETGHDAGTRIEASSDHIVEEEQEKSKSTEGLSREELGRLVASRWTGESAGKEDNELNKDKEEEEDGNPEIPEAAPNNEYDGYTTDNDDDDRRYANDEAEDNDMDDEHYDPVESYDTDVEDKKTFSDSESSQSWLDKIQQTVRNILQAVNVFKTPVDISGADRVRKEYDESSQKLSKIQSRISSLSEKLKHDFGMEKEFYSFHDQCFENKQNKYVYKVCPFKQASQVEGHSKTQLGRWEKFEESYRVMVFSHGDKCWNGPDRSLKVRLRCGLKIELTDVDEPSRCEYIALLSTPALCLEEKLKELQQKLDSMNTNQPQNHDEL